MSDLIVSKWLNSKDDISLTALRGNVVIIYVFQMLCPACVIHSIPQANKIYQIFHKEKLQVLGLHSVFEHHDAMKEESLKAFIHEFGIKFPVAIDQVGTKNNIPKTMEKYSMQGTPTMLIYDKFGELKLQRFGHVEDLELGFIIGSILSESV
jgi:peroxiredoxin